MSKEEPRAAKNISDYINPSGVWNWSPSVGGYVSGDDYWTWITPETWEAANPATTEPLPLEFQSEVRITFSRGFTWSERETFRGFVERSNSSHYWVNPSVVYIYSVLDSRGIVDKVSEFVAQEYLNIHPRAVRTFYPEVIV